MGRKKIKFGERVSVYLSNESIEKAKELSPNMSSLVDFLIIKEWGEANAKTQARAIQEEAV